MVIDEQIWKLITNEKEKRKIRKMFESRRTEDITLER